MSGMELREARRYDCLYSPLESLLVCMKEHVMVLEPLTTARATNVIPRPIVRLGSEARCNALAEDIKLMLTGGGNPSLRRVAFIQAIKAD